jgi:hypothetical protein
MTHSQIPKIHKSLNLNNLPHPTTYNPLPAPYNQHGGITNV